MLSLFCQMVASLSHTQMNFYIRLCADAEVTMTTWMGDDDDVWHCFDLSDAT